MRYLPLIFIVALMMQPINSLAFSSCTSYATGGGASLLAQNSGLTGYGYTKDVMIWPGGDSCAGSRTTVGGNVSFQFNTSTSSCPYLGIAFSSYEVFDADIVNWVSGNFVTGCNSPGGSNGNNSCAFSNPGGWGIFIFYIENDYSVNDESVAVACGSSPSNARSNAMSVARANEP
jgi:hypothetical protein